MTTLNLNNYIEQTHPIEIDLGDGNILTGLVRLNGINDAFIEKNKDSPNFDLQCIERCFKSLDITLDGKPFEINIENLKLLPISLKEELVFAIREKRLELKKKKTKASSDTSLPTGD